VLAIEALDLHGAEVDTVEAPDVHVDSVGMRARDVEAGDTTVATEEVARRHRPELIRRESVFAREQAELLPRQDQMEIRLPGADGAVALRHGVQVTRHLEADAAAVTAAGMGRHAARC
jgi:hypothetical protein